MVNVCRQINKHVVIKDSSRHIEFLKMLITTIWYKIKTWYIPLIYTLAQFYLKLNRTSHGCCDKKALTHYAENVHMMSRFFWRCIKFVSDFRHVSGFLRLPPVYSTNKTDRHDITEILLKVTLNAINLNQPSIVYKIFNIGKEPGWLCESGSWIT